MVPIARGLCVVLLLAGVTSASAITGGDSQSDSALSRLREIALIYVEAYETARRFEDYSRRNSDLEADVLNDDTYYQSAFGTNALDVRGSFTAEVLQNAPVTDTHFFRVYSSTMSPPHPEFIVGVKTNGTVLRFQGFPESDFDRMIHGTNAGSQESLDETIRLYYRLHTAFDPGPILGEGTLRDASRVLAKESGGQDVSRELFLPKREIVQASTIVSLCVFDSQSTRLEIHRVRVDRDGGLQIVEQRILRDAKRISY